MRLSICLSKNLNYIHWNRRVWEIGYRGPLLPQRKATGRPDLPVTDNQVLLLRERLSREYDVMKYLASPYFTKTEEAEYITLKGSPSEQRAAELQIQELRRMPGKPKRITSSKATDRRVANVGNLLHNHRAVEDSMRELIRRYRWD
ncbi:hypothetical protein AB6A40_003304 [Gnathostoma spinigerum]|uniref:Uncharacterized protein n=1 Tax=Gnathostoma spinigerum TaxID=75299 RepID=A0ABD6E958_9BILA